MNGPPSKRWKFIDVKYEELKGVFTPAEAMAKDAPLLA
jgi:CO/xanthine dehydrogenase Mo-binding subunit